MITVDVIEYIDLIKQCYAGYNYTLNVQLIKH